MGCNALKCLALLLLARSSSAAGWNVVVGGHSFAANEPRREYAKPLPMKQHPSQVPQVTHLDVRMSGDSSPLSKLRFRRGMQADTFPIALTMVQEFMNPLSINHERFLVAMDEDGQRVGFGQIRELGEAGGLWELASIYVVQEWRGRGLGSELVRRLLDAHSSAGNSLSSVYLLTIASTLGFYSRLGFTQCEDANVPKSMAFEVAAGSVISSVLGNKLVCMKYDSAKA